MKREKEPLKPEFGRVVAARLFGPDLGTPPQQMAMLRAAIDAGDVPLPFGALAVLSCVADGILIENKQLDGNLIDAPAADFSNPGIDPYHGRDRHDLVKVPWWAVVELAYIRHLLAHEIRKGSFNSTTLTRLFGGMGDGSGNRGFFARLRAAEQHKKMAWSVAGVLAREPYPSETMAIQAVAALYARDEKVVRAAWKKYGPQAKEEVLKAVTEAQR